MEQITLDMIPNSHTPIAHISQYDSGRHIRFNLQNITLTGSETVTLKIRKPDGELVSKVIENHTSYVEYVSETADCDVSGKSNCEIVISKDDVVIGSKNFIMEVEADAYDGANVVTKTASGRIATFETNLADVLQSLKCEITASGGNGSPDSPIPIVGHSELNLTRCGANFTDISDNTISGAGYVIGGFPVAINTDNLVLPSGNYVFSFNLTGATYPCACQLIWYRNGVEVGNTVANITSSGINSIAFTASGEFDSLVMFCNSSSGGAFTNFNLNIGSTPSAYEPYNGQTFTVAFGQTVYGGVYDKSGRLMITWLVIDMGTLNYTYDNDGRFFANLNTKALGQQNLRCENYANSPSGSASQMPDNSVKGNDGNTYFYVRDTSAGTDAAAFKASLSGVKLAYELATPIVIDVPSISVFAEKGTNNVFSDTGDTEVKYLYKA